MVTEICWPQNLLSFISFFTCSACALNVADSVINEEVRTILYAHNYIPIGTLTLLHMKDLLGGDSIPSSSVSTASDSLNQNDAAEERENYLKNNSLQRQCVPYF